MGTKKIKIGVAVPLSGLAKNLGLEMAQAIMLVVEEKDKQGGIAGIGIECVVVDDESNVAKAEVIANGFCSDAQVLAVIGHYGSDTSLAAARIFETYHLPMVSPIASDPLLTESGLKCVFRYTNRDNRTGEAISNYVFKKLNKRSVLLIQTDSAYGHSMTTAFKKVFMEIGGTITGELTVDEGNKDFKKLVVNLPKTFDLVFYGGTYEGAPLLKDLRKHGFNQLMATGDGCWDKINFLEPAGPAAGQGEGVLVLSASSKIGDVRGSDEFSAKYERRFGPIMNYALNAHDAACIVLQALEDAALSNTNGSLTRTTVNSAIRQVNFTGLANPNPVRWNEKGDNLSAITRLNTVKNGRFVEITPVI